MKDKEIHLGTINGNENVIYMSIETWEIIDKALKVLKIIKETPEFAWYVSNYKNAYEMVVDVKGFRVNESVEELQEKFDLLKEVLSND